MAEIFGPYDPASPCPTTVCKRISKEEYESQTAEATQSAISDLINYLEYNPTAYHNILRKRKREDLENGGVFSWLKVKMLSAMLGDEYVEKIDVVEAKQKIAALKEEMISVYNYSEDGKGSGRRFSRRLANRKEMVQKKTVDKNIENCNGLLPDPQCSIVKSLEGDLLASSPDSTKNTTPVSRPSFAPPKPPPPPPLPPLAFTGQIAQQVCKESPFQLKKTDKLSKDHMQTRESSTTKVNTRSKSKAMKENMCESSDGTVQNLLNSIKNPNLRASLKPVNIGFTDETPYQIRKKINKLKDDAEKEFSLFNQKLINKFQNARSPQSPQYLSDVSPSGSFNISP